MVSNKRNFIRAAVCFAILIAAVILGICAGSEWISPIDVFSELFSENLTQNGRILLYIRLPRVLAALLAGCALAVSGAIIQAVLSNPLAAPNIIGVNSGAVLFTVICIAFFPKAPFLQPFAAFAGAFVTVLAVFLIARKTGASRMTIVLAGVGVSSLLNAFSDTITTLFPDVLAGVSAFKNGSVSWVTYSSISPAWILIAVGISAAILLRHDLDVLSLGENTARSLGMNVSAMRLVFLAIAALLAGAAVSFSGLIGFVGLVVPHIARKISKSSENRVVIPFCAIIGAAFLIICDTLSRTIFAPYELPLGIVVSYIGVPFFIALLIGKRGGKHGD